MNQPWADKQEKREAYELLLKQLSALIDHESNMIANLSNSLALLNDFLPNTIFAGYYLFDGHQLVLGPFQGKVSCVRIDMGKGVCGEAALTGKTIIVDDVHQIQNYISCDNRAQSEIVVPILRQDKLLGVLDIDASVVNAYDTIDQIYLEKFVDILIQHTYFTK